MYIQPDKLVGVVTILARATLRDNPHGLAHLRLGQEKLVFPSHEDVAWHLDLGGQARPVSDTIRAHCGVDFAECRCQHLAVWVYPPTDPCWASGSVADVVHQPHTLLRLWSIHPLR